LDVHSQSPSDSAEATKAGSGELLDIAELTRRMVKGDEMAFRIFHDAYFDRLSRYLLVVTAGNEEATRDALQAALTRVVRHIKVFSTEAVFWSWLTVLARSALADETRKRRRYLAFLDRFAEYSRAELEIARSGQADERLGLLLERGVALLPADERQLVEWKYFEHQPVSRIAERLQTTEKAVESRLGRLRRKLKETVLAELQHEPTD
jgi:RNA polymerase sigma-70 factor (ECF subfamily)